MVKMKFCVYCTVILLLFLFVCVFSRPIFPQMKPPPSPKIPSIEAFNFMKRFGYLEEGTSDSEALYSEAAIVEAIKNVQKFGALPQTGVADNATLELMKSRRCGVPDVIKHRSKRFVLGSKGWRKHHITYFLANWTPKLGEDVTVKNIQQALDMWGKYGRLRFTRVNDPNADIIVAFARGPHGDSFPFDGPGTILAHAFFPYEQRGYGGDIHFDDEEEWTIHTRENEEGTDFFRVAIHELGHSLGLAHSPVLSSIMFPYYKGYSPHFALDYDDILGMYELYIKGVPDVIDEPIEPKTTTESVFDEEPECTTPRYKSTAEETTPKGSQDEFDDNGDRNPDDPWESDEEQSSGRKDESSTITYEGDFETVDEHKKHEGKHGTHGRRKNTTSVPDICEGSFDAVATLRDELFIFKDQYIWRLQERHSIEPGYPVQIHQMFPKLPTSVKSVDAAYERPDGMIVLFKGNEFWVYNGHDFIEGSPQPLSAYGLPRSLDKIDAVQIWGKNGKTYFYKNDRFWRYNETTRTMDSGYPKHMEKWRGVPHNIDAATTWKDGYTYFFKDKFFWKFDNDWVIVTETSPLPAPQTWLGCPEKQDIRDYFSRYSD